MKYYYLYYVIEKKTKLSTFTKWKKNIHCLHIYCIAMKCSVCIWQKLGSHCAICPSPRISIKKQGMCMWSVAQWLYSVMGSRTAYFLFRKKRPAVVNLQGLPEILQSWTAIALWHILRDISQCDQSWAFQCDTPLGHGGACTVWHEAVLWDGRKTYNLKGL